MARLTPNVTYQMLGVTVNEKIILDGTRWTDAAKAVNQIFGSLVNRFSCAHSGVILMLLAPFGIPLHEGS